MVTAEGNLVVGTQAWGEQVDLIYDDTHRYIGMSAGIGAGKTECGTIKSERFCVNHPGVDGLIVAPDYNRVHGALVPKYIDVFPRDFWAEVPHGNPPNGLTILGNRLFFRSTTDPQTLRAFTVGFIHHDEPAYSPAESFPVLQGRLRQIEAAQYWGTTSPNIENPLNWFWAEFVVKGDRDSFILYTLDTLMNPFLPEATKRDLIEQYSGDMQRIELQGMFIPMSGNCFFDTDILRRQIENDIIEPRELRYNDECEIWKPSGPGRRFVAGIDTAEGRQAGDTSEGEGNPDYQCMWIRDYRTGELVVRYKTRIPLDEFLYNCAEIAEEYNSPFVGIEINYDKQSARKLIDFGWDEGQVYCWKEEEPGWLTTEPTRRVMLREYEEAFRQGDVIIHSRQAIMEHLSFIRNKAGRPQGAYNAHDDDVIAGAISQQMMKWATFPMMTKVDPKQENAYTFQEV